MLAAILEMVVMELLSPTAGLQTVVRAAAAVVELGTIILTQVALAAAVSV